MATFSIFFLPFTKTCGSFYIVMTKVLKIDEETHREAKSRAAASNMYLHEFVIAAIRAFKGPRVDKPRRSSRPTKPAG